MTGMAGVREDGLMIELLIDLVPGLFKSFRGLVGGLFQLPFDLFSNLLLLQLCCCLLKALFNLMPDLLRSVPDSFKHTRVAGWFFISEHEGG